MWRQGTIEGMIEVTIEFTKEISEERYVDPQGTKMSKSLGNTQDPLTFIEGGKDAKKEPAYGADVLRLWVASVDFQGDVLIGPNIIAQAGLCFHSGGCPGSLLS